MAEVFNQAGAKVVPNDEMASRRSAVTLKIALPRAGEQALWNPIKKRVGEEARWQSPNGALEIAIEVQPGDGPGYAYFIITGNNRTDEYDYDNDSGQFSSFRKARDWAVSWMAKHQLEGVA